MLIGLVDLDEGLVSSAEAPLFLCFLGDLLARFVGLLVVVLSDFLLDTLQDHFLDLRVREVKLALFLL